MVDYLSFNRDNTMCLQFEDYCCCLRLPHDRENDDLEQHFTTFQTALSSPAVVSSYALLGLVT